jgi:hypothetical protein
MYLPLSQERVCVGRYLQLKYPNVIPRSATATSTHQQIALPRLGFAHSQPNRFHSLKAVPQYKGTWALISVLSSSIVAKRVFL